MRKDGSTRAIRRVRGGLTPGLLDDAPLDEGGDLLVGKVQFFEDFTALLTKQGHT